MKRLFPYIAFACLTGFTATTGLPVIAGGCSSHMNKKAEIKCAEAVSYTHLTLPTMS